VWPTAADRNRELLFGLGLPFSPGVTAGIELLEAPTMGVAKSQNLFLIVYQPVSPQPYPQLGEALQELGYECQVLDYAWALKTDHDAAYVHDWLVRSSLRDPGDRFILAPLAGPWQSYQCKTAGECFHN
jgi:hypothetical protein